MGNTRPIIVRWLLMPFSFLYGIVVWMRNLLFQWKILPSERFDVPVISVGNITVGGTGKTPMSEYLIRILKTDRRVALLSRGYKRKSRGFQLLPQDPLADLVGDEPCQIKRKFPDVMVAVDANRRRGIRALLENKNGAPDVIVLDDAFQHRYVNPNLSILLVDYNRMITDDCLLPAGELREPVSAKSRANIVVVTKCPDNMQPVDYRIIQQNLRLFPYQSLFFSTLHYGELTPVFPDKVNGRVRKSDLQNHYSTLLVTGIASPQPLRRHLSNYCFEISDLRYPDHHAFTLGDMQEIEKKFDAISAKNKIIVTTEKDAVRLFSHPDFPEKLKRYIYYVPLYISFLRDEAPKFDEKVRSYLTKEGGLY